MGELSFMTTLTWHVGFLDQQNVYFSFKKVFLFLLFKACLQKTHYFQTQTTD